MAGYTREQFFLALAGSERVRSYSRKSKTGKIVHVDSYTRDPGKMTNLELFREYQSLSGGKSGLEATQAKNRQQQIINEIRSRQSSGAWGTQTKKAVAPKAVSKKAAVKAPPKVPAEPPKTVPTKAAAPEPSKTPAPEPSKVTPAKTSAPVSAAKKAVAQKESPKAKATAPAKKAAPDEVPDTGHSTVKEFKKNQKAPQAELKPGSKEYEEHIAKVRQVINDPANVAKYDTTQLHGLLDPNTDPPTPVEGVYKPERFDEHKKIIDDILAAHSHVPKERKAVMSGGLGGAGKGFVLGNHAGIDKTQFLTVDPDEMKAELLKRGLVPEIPGLLPMEHAKFMHEESSDLANMLMDVATREGMNVILDTTMGSTGSAQKKIAKFHDRGYDVEGVFVDVPITVSQSSAAGRHLGGVNRFRRGEMKDLGFLGGRYVPPEYIEAAAPEPDSPYNSKNRGVFEELKNMGLFTRSRVYDNSVRAKDSEPKLISDKTHKTKSGALGLSAVQVLRDKLTRVNGSR
jgi:hypothetical protein